MEFVGQFWDVFCLALPDDKDFPAGLSQFSEIAFVSIDVALSFCLPEFFACGWCNFTITAAMDVPETAMNKNDLLMTREN